MHFRIKRIKLLNALAKATRAVSVRSPLPVLTGIKFDLQAHQLILTGSDSDITIQTIIDEDDDLVILKEGAVVLNSRYIFDIVRKINSDDIEIAREYEAIILRKFKNGEFLELYDFMLAYSKSKVCKRAPHYFLDYLILHSKDYPNECLKLIENIDFSRNPNAHHILCASSSRHFNCSGSRDFTVNSFHWGVLT